MTDWAAEGFLDEVADEARAGRIELLEHLSARGFTLDELRDQHPSLLPFLPAERIVMGGPPRLSMQDLADGAGVPVELLIRLRRAQGLAVPEPGRACFSERELAIGRNVAAFRAAGIGEQQVEETARVLGRGLARAAMVMRATLLELALAPGATERELSERYEALVEGVLPLVSPMLDQSLRMHLRNMMETEAVGAVERQSGRLPGARDIAVAFADLVGFTRLGEELPPEELGAVADRLARIAADVANAPVQMVKTIGDAAMLVSPDAGALVATGLTLVAAVEEEGAAFPQVRVGIAHGAALNRSGDWFGRPVNIASRVTAVARAGSVLVTQDVRDRAAARFAWSFAGTRQLKGIEHGVALHRARRQPDQT